MNLLTSRASAQLYFIPVYIQLMLLTPIIGRLLGTRWRWLLWLVSPLSIALAVYVPLVAGVPLGGVPSALWGECCLGWLGFYCLGLAVGNGVLHVRVGVRPLVAAYVLALLAQVAEGYLFLLLGSQNSGTQLKLSSLVASGLLCLIAWRFVQGRDALGSGLLVKAAVSLGDCSFGVYLSHIAFLRVLNKVLSFVGVVGVIMLVVLTLLSSWVFVIVAGRLFGRRLSRLLGLR